MLFFSEDKTISRKKHRLFVFLLGASCMQMGANLSFQAYSCGNLLLIIVQQSSKAHVIGMEIGHPRDCTPIEGQKGA